MTSTLQGLIIALLVGLLVGIVLAYLLTYGRLRRQRQALEDHRKQLAELEKSYDIRLREATQRLKHDYETELSETIEHYQDQLSARTLELQQAYETRLNVVQQGLEQSAEPSPPPVAPAPDPTISPVEVKRLKQQYEKRLKDAAHKLQHAYEKQLAQYAKTVKAELQADFDQRLAQKTEHFDQQLAAHKAQLEREHAARQAEVLTPNEPTQALTSGPPAAVTPSQIMDTGDEPTVTLQPMRSAPVPPPHASTAITQEDIDARIRLATQQIRQEYEQQMSSKLKEYRDQVSSRVRDLEDTYQNKLNALAQVQAESAPPPERQQQDGESLDPLDLSDINQLT